MPLDKVLISHLEKQDELEDGIEADVDTLVDKLSIPDLMQGAEEILLGLVAAVQEQLKESYYPESAKNGVEFATDIEKDGDIQVPKTDDPVLNKELADGDKGESTT